MESWCAWAHGVFDARRVAHGKVCGGGQRPCPFPPPVTYFMVPVTLREARGWVLPEARLLLVKHVGEFIVQESGGGGGVLEGCAGLGGGGAPVHECVVCTAQRVVEGHTSIDHVTWQH